jgi:hypothetical protein
VYGARREESQPVSWIHDRQALKRTMWTALEAHHNLDSNDKRPVNVPWLEDSTERIMIVDGVEYHRNARDKHVDGAGRASWCTRTPMTGMNLLRWKPSRPPSTESD